MLARYILVDDEHEPKLSGNTLIQTATTKTYLQQWIVLTSRALLICFLKRYLRQK